MLYAKFQDHRTTGSGEDFLKVFTIYGRGGHLGHVTWTVYTNFRSHLPRRLHMKFGFDRPSESLKMVGYTISSPCEPTAKLS